MSTQQEKVFRILTQLDAKVKRCQKCAIALTRTKTVFGTGNPMADLIIVGEGPGTEEDAQGVPFVGASGKLLDRILATMQRDRSMVYILNCVKCQCCTIEGRYRKNRPPTPQELNNCSDWFDSQMEALPNKKLILSFGASASNRCLGRFEEPYPMWKLRFKYLNSAFVDTSLSNEIKGKTSFLGLTTVPLVCTYHPSYLLRAPEEKIKTYNDIMFAKKYLDATDEERENFDRAFPDDPPQRERYAKIEDKRKWGFPKDFQKDTYSEKVEAL